VQGDTSVVLLGPEDDVIMILRNFGNSSPIGTA